MRIGDSIVMLAEARGEWQPTSSTIHLYVPDCDAVYEMAMKAGAKSVREPADQFYGDRTGGVRDCCGNIWWIATHVEDVAPDEIEQRAQSMAASAAGSV